MHDDEWQRTFMFRANVNEVNFEPIDLGDELSDARLTNMALDDRSWRTRCPGGLKS